MKEYEMDIFEILENFIVTEQLWTMFSFLLKSFYSLLFCSEKP